MSKRTIETEINICLDSCLYRIGASGSERKAILDILYKGMINRNLPNIYRYILWCAVNKTHLFRKLNRSDRSSQNQSREIWWNEIKDVGEKVIQSNEAFLEERGQPLSEKAKEILKCSRQILHQKQQIQNYGQGYDTMIKALRQNLTPVQFAQLFLFVEGSIHKKQLQMFGDSEDIQHATLRKLQANQMAQGSEQSQRKLRVGQSTQGQAAISMREGQLLEIGGSGRKRQKPNEQ